MIDLIKLIEIVDSLRSFAQANVNPVNKVGAETETKDYFLGKYVIVRSSPDGVTFGKVQSITERSIVLSEVRRLWRWYTPTGVSLEDVATYGVKTDKTRASAEIPMKKLLGDFSVIECTDVCVKSIKSQPVTGQD